MVPRIRTDLPKDVWENLYALKDAVRARHPGGGMAAGYCVCGGQGRAGPACLAFRWLLEREEQLWDLER